MTFLYYSICFNTILFKLRVDTCNARSLTVIIIYQYACIVTFSFSRNYSNEPCLLYFYVTFLCYFVYCLNKIMFKARFDIATCNARSLRVICIFQACVHCGLFHFQEITQISPACISMWRFCVISYTIWIKYCLKQGLILLHVMHVH